MNNIGKRIKELRKKNDLTQEKLADYLGVTYKSVSKWECGVTVPDIALIGPLTKVLHVSADELLGLTDEAGDEKRARYDKALQKYYDSEAAQVNYAFAREAATDYPDDYRYTEWLAHSEYLLAFEESKSEKDCGSVDFITEMTDNALRRYETIIEECTDRELVRRAVIGKITVLRFAERVEEAEWSAEFEFHDAEINTAEQVLMLTQSGRELLCMLEEECRDG